jgi:predicted DCC family thiol-disulfide oxidoreductase YuxK
MPAAEPELVLLYDGLCGFCDGAVQFILARDPRGAMKFAPLQGDFARGVLARHTALAGLDSLVLVRRRPDGTEHVLVESAAVVAIGHYLGGVWGVLGALLRLVPPFLRNAGYGAFARMRYRVFGKFDACPLPSAEQRARFLS